MWSKQVQTIVQRGYAAVRGSADGQIVPATGGSAPSVLVYAEGDSDVGAPVAVGEYVTVLTDPEDREFFAQVSATVQDWQLLMPASDGSLVPCTSGNYYCAQCLAGTASGTVARVRPAQGKMP